MNKSEEAKYLMIPNNLLKSFVVHIGVVWVRKLEGLKVRTVFPKNDTIACANRRISRSRI